MTKINVIYASEMGTAMGIADDVIELASSKGIETSLNEMNDISIDQLRSISAAMFIISSTGDGDLPMMGEDFWSALENSNITLKNLKYSVCALGDRNYFSFCLCHFLSNAEKKCCSERRKCGFEILQITAF